MNVATSGHHVPAARKTKDRPFEVARSDKSRATLFPLGDDPEHDHWRMHNAERSHVGPRQGDFDGTDKELFQAYKDSYKDLTDIKVDVKSPDGTKVLGTDVTLTEAVELMEEDLCPID